MDFKECVTKEERERGYESRHDWELTGSWSSRHSSSCAMRHRKQVHVKTVLLSMVLACSKLTIVHTFLAQYQARQWF